MQTVGVRDYAYLDGRTPSFGVQALDLQPLFSTCRKPKQKIVATFATL